MNLFSYKYTTPKGGVGNFFCVLHGFYPTGKNGYLCPMANLQAMLQRADLRKTGARLAILEFLQSARGASALSDLERDLGQVADRATLYRTLITFEEHGLVHRVVDPEGVVRYALCGTDCHTQDHNHAHVHFSCSQCGQLLCLSETHLPAIALPPGFQPQGLQLVFHGLCDHCSGATASLPPLTS
jgi:Fur family transcriptional regulator, ferric uptake regulator